MSKISAIITAAGSGQRMGESVPKQFVEVCGKPLFIYTLEVFNLSSVVDDLILVVPANTLQDVTDMIKKWQIEKVKNIVAGGSERQFSVQNGLNVVSKSTELVLIHDGVRPFVTQNKIKEVISVAKKSGAAILAIPVTDTIKKSHGQQVDSTLNRKELWRVQTPQCFRKDWILEAYQNAGEGNILATDDAFLLERIGHPVQIVPGLENNIKITSPTDLKIAEIVIREALS